jgi:hypothetical protein
VDELEEAANETHAHAPVEMLSFLRTPQPAHIFHARTNQSEEKFFCELGNPVVWLVKGTCVGQHLPMIAGAALADSSSAGVALNTSITPMLHEIYFQAETVTKLQV